MSRLPCDISKSQQLSSRAHVQAATATIAQAKKGAVSSGAISADEERGRGVQVDIHGGGITHCEVKGEHQAPQRQSFELLL